MPHEQSFKRKGFRHTQFNTNTYIDKSLRNMYYIVEFRLLALDSLTAVRQSNLLIGLQSSHQYEPYYLLTKSYTDYRALPLICIAI